VRLLYDLQGEWPWPSGYASGDESASLFRADCSDAVCRAALVDNLVWLHSIERQTSWKSSLDTEFFSILAGFSEAQCVAAQEFCNNRTRGFRTWSTLRGLTGCTEQQALCLRLVLELEGDWPWEETPGNTPPAVYTYTPPTHPPASAGACASIGRIIWGFDGWRNGWAWYDVILYGTGCGASGASGVYFEVVLESDDGGYWWADHRPAVELPSGATHSFTAHVACPPGERTRIFASLSSGGYTLDSGRTDWFVPPHIPRDFYWTQ